MHALKKIQKSTLYQNFDQVLKDQMLAQPFAVALSGGVDSMALAMVAKTYAIEHDIDLHCLIVNHHLRQESSVQIASLTAYLSTQNIQFQVLDWEHGDIKTAIQVKARKARYDLLKNYCETHKISMLMTAHHLLDQIETYYLRQEKESGIVGLAGMNVVSYLGDIKLIRPFLELDKKELVKFCEAFEVPWWEDASNQDTKYRRNALRKTLTVKEISFAKGALLKAKLQKKMLYKEIILWVEKYIEMNHLGEVSIQLVPDLLSQSDMSLYFWGLVLKLYSGKEYAPKFEKRRQMLQKLSQNERCTMTIWGLILKKKKDKLYLYRESRAILKEPVCLQNGGAIIWDHRFKITLELQDLSLKNSVWEVFPMAEKLANFKEVPYLTRKTLPILKNKAIGDCILLPFEGKLMDKGSLIDLGEDCRFEANFLQKITRELINV